MGIASKPISPITADNICNCAGSSSRMHGFSKDFAATISTVFDEPIPTMPYLWHPICHSIPSHLRISQGSVRIHKPVQTIAVIALLRTKIDSVSKSISNGRQFLIPVVSPIAAFAPLWSTSDSLLPILAQRHWNSAQEGVLSSHASFKSLRLTVCLDPSNL